LSGIVPSGSKFNWCAYATDYPPNAKENNGYYDLNGTPPFEVNGTKLGEGVKTFNDGCITSLTDATGCPGILPTPPVVNTFAALPDSICPGGTATLTATATDAVSYSFDNDISWMDATASASTVVTPNQDTAYTVHIKNIAGCTATFATAASVTFYPLPDTKFVNAPDSLCAGSTFTLTAEGGASYCFSQTCDACIRNPYLTGNDSMGAANCSVVPFMCADYDASNSYTLTMPESGSVTVWVRAMSEHGCIDSTKTVIVARPWATIRLLSAETSTQQTRGYSETIETITYVIENASGATVTGLPDGVSYSYTNDTLTISGAPTDVGAYSYTVTPTGPCIDVFAQGTLTATPSFIMTKATGTAASFTAIVRGGYFTVDWGDGNPAETFTPNTAQATYSHTYSVNEPHIITGTAASLTYLYCPNQQLSALDVRGATALTRLDCYSNQLTALDVSKNIALTNLYCYSNQLTALDVSKNIALTTLHCYSNQLTALDVRGATALTTLLCYSNQLTALDVSANTQLTALLCYSNQLTALDVSKNIALTNLQCNSNQLMALDVSKNTLLGRFYCNNNQLMALNVSKNIALAVLYCYSNLLDTLDVSANTALTTLYCHNNLLAALDVSANTALTSLQCNNNQLAALDVSENTLLTTLYCNNNPLDTLDISNNTALVNLYCFGNQLTALDVSLHTALRDLRCYSNQLTALDVSANPALTILQVQNNQLSQSALEALFGTLHSNPGTKTITIGGNSGAATCDRTIATNKGWTVN
jgi:hypothetical protein